MSANYTPEKEDLEILTPFKMQVLTNFPYIEADFDALTNYQLLCKVVEYLNNVISETNEVTEQTLSLYNAYVALQNYVNDYFDNLNLQEEVNIKLDEMATDGSLTLLIKNYVDPIYQAYEERINGEIDTQNTSIGNLSTSVQTISQGLTTETSNRTSADTNLQTQINTIVASAGTAGDSSSEIVQARTNIMSTAFSVLNDRISFIEKTTPFSMSSISNIDLDNYITPIKAVVSGTNTNSPFAATKSFYLVVEGFNSGTDINISNSFQWIIQKAYLLTRRNPEVAYRLCQRYQGNYIFGDWNKIANNGFETISAATNLNTIINEGSYALTNASNENNPLGTQPAFLTVHKVRATADNTWLTQTVTDTQMRSLYTRFIIHKDVNPYYSSWAKIYPQEVNSAIQLAGKKIVNFGDSIFGNFRDDTSVSSEIRNITDATVYNVGFGGCRMSMKNTEYQYWRDFSMVALTNAIVNNDFSIQDADIANEAWTTKPSYFDDTLSTLESIDFSNIDYITIAYGTNDYAGNISLDNPDNPKDTTTYAGALRYCIETLLTAFPNLKILVGSPTFRLWLSSGEVEYTSDTRVFNGGYTLIQMTEKTRDICKDYHLPFVDAYNELGLNQYDYTSFFSGGDTTHPNAYGRKLLGRLYGMTLLK